MPRPSNDLQEEGPEYRGSFGLGQLPPSEQVGRWRLWAGGDSPLLALHVKRGSSLVGWTLSDHAYFVCSVD